MNKLLDLRELLKYRSLSQILSLIFILGAFGVLGMNYVNNGAFLYKGIDFTGGLRLLFQFDRPITPDRLRDLRNLLHQEARDARVKTFGLDEGGGRRGVMVTMRGHDLVDRLTQTLFQLGRSTSPPEDPFQSVSDRPGLRLVEPEVLRQNFRLAGDDKDKIDLTRADRSLIQRRAQSIVNEQLSQSVIDLLKSGYTKQSDVIDLNWAGEDTIQNWLQERQLEGFLQRFKELRSGQTLSSLDDLRPLLEQFSISYSRFSSVFTVGGDNPDLLDLTRRKPEQIQDVMMDEFFRNRYTREAQAILEAREQRGLFESLEQVLQLRELRDLYKPTLRDSAGLSPFVMVRSEMVSPAIGADLIGYALMAILISLVGILAYLYIRFQLTYSIGAIAAILHDVIVTVGFLTLLRVEFNVPVVAAVLTVIGYSLNDTIVNFDRVRENRTLMGYKASWYDVVNRSVYEVLNRTIVTSLTTFIAVLVLYLYGGIALQGFSLTLLFGVIIGTYSSIFVSNLVLYRLQKSMEA